MKYNESTPFKKQMDGGSGEPRAHFIFFLLTPSILRASQLIRVPFFY